MYVKGKCCGKGTSTADGASPLFAARGSRSWAVNDDCIQAQRPAVPIAWLDGPGIRSPPRPKVQQTDNSTMGHIGSRNDRPVRWTLLFPCDKNPARWAGLWESVTLRAGRGSACHREKRSLRRPVRVKTAWPNDLSIRSHHSSSTAKMPGVK